MATNESPDTKDTTSLNEQTHIEVLFDRNVDKTEVDGKKHATREGLFKTLDARNALSDEAFAKDRFMKAREGRLTQAEAEEFATMFDVKPPSLLAFDCDVLISLPVVEYVEVQSGGRVQKVLKVKDGNKGTIQPAKDIDIPDVDELVEEVITNLATCIKPHLDKVVGPDSPQRALARDKVEKAMKVAYGQLFGLPGYVMREFEGRPGLKPNPRGLVTASPNPASFDNAFSKFRAVFQKAKEGDKRGFVAGFSTKSVDHSKALISGWPSNRAEEALRKANYGIDAAANLTDLVDATPPLYLCYAGEDDKNAKLLIPGWVRPREVAKIFGGVPVRKQQDQGEVVAVKKDVVDAPTQPVAGPETQEQAAKRAIEAGIRKFEKLDRRLSTATEDLKTLLKECLAFLAQRRGAPVKLELQDDATNANYALLYAIMQAQGALFGSRENAPGKRQIVQANQTLGSLPFVNKDDVTAEGTRLFTQILSLLPKAVVYGEEGLRESLNSKAIGMDQIAACFDVDPSGIDKLKSESWKELTITPAILADGKLVAKGFIRARGFKPAPTRPDAAAQPATPERAEQSKMAACIHALWPDGFKIGKIPSAAAINELVTKQGLEKKPLNILKTACQVLAELQQRLSNIAAMADEQRGERARRATLNAYATLFGLRDFGSNDLGTDQRGLTTLLGDDALRKACMGTLLAMANQANVGRLEASVSDRLNTDLPKGGVYNADELVTTPALVVYEPDGTRSVLAQGWLRMPTQEPPQPAPAPDRAPAAAAPAAPRPLPTPRNFKAAKEAANKIANPLKASQCLIELWGVDFKLTNPVTQKQIDAIVARCDDAADRVMLQRVAKSLLKVQQDVTAFRKRQIEYPQLRGSLQTEYLSLFGLDQGIGPADTPDTVLFADRDMRAAAYRAFVAIANKMGDEQRPLRIDDTQMDRVRWDMPKDQSDADTFLTPPLTVVSGNQPFDYLAKGWNRRIARGTRQNARETRVGQPTTPVAGPRPDNANLYWRRNKDGSLDPISPEEHLEETKAAEQPETAKPAPEPIPAAVPLKPASNPVRFNKLKNGKIVGDLLQPKQSVFGRLGAGIASFFRALTGRKAG
jgi:hypothetical protein